MTFRMLDALIQSHRSIACNQHLTKHLMASNPDEQLKLSEYKLNHGTAGTWSIINVHQINSVMNWWSYTYPSACSQKLYTNHQIIEHFKELLNLTLLRYFHVLNAWELSFRAEYVLHLSNVRKLSQVSLLLHVVDFWCLQLRLRYHMHLIQVLWEVCSTLVVQSRHS